jgi:hypothetical protein
MLLNIMVEKLKVDKVLFKDAIFVLNRMLWLNHNEVFVQPCLLLP